MVDEDAPASQAPDAADFASRARNMHEPISRAVEQDEFVRSLLGKSYLSMEPDTTHATGGEHATTDNAVLVLSAPTVRQQLIENDMMPPFSHKVQHLTEIVSAMGFPRMSRLSPELQAYYRKLSISEKHAVSQLFVVGLVPNQSQSTGKCGIIAYTVTVPVQVDAVRRNDDLLVVSDGKPRFDIRKIGQSKALKNMPALLVLPWSSNPLIQLPEAADLRQLLQAELQKTRPEVICLHSTSLERHRGRYVIMCQPSAGVWTGHP